MSMKDFTATADSNSSMDDTEPKIIAMVPLFPAKPFMGHRADDISDVQLGVAVAICVVLFLLIVTGNLMVILAIQLYKKLQTVTNCFVCSLAVSDLLVGLLAPFTILTTIYPDAELFRTNYQCIVPFAAFTTLLHASIYNLTAVTIDRYIAITRPFQYKEIVSKTRAKIVIACCWTCAFAIGFVLPFLWNTGPLQGHCAFKEVLPTEYYLLTTLGVPVPNISVIILLYISIGRVAHSQAAKMAECSTEIDGVGHLNKATRAYNKERKATLTIAIIICVFLFCWLPFICFFSVDLLSGSQVHDANLSFARVLLAFLAIANSCANPFIYALRLRNFRVAFWEIVTKSTCCRRIRSRGMDLRDQDHVGQQQKSKVVCIGAIFRCRSEDLFCRGRPKGKKDLLPRSSPDLTVFTIDHSTS